MFTQFPSPLCRETACRSHDYQVTLRLPLHTFRGPEATLHGQVLLSDRFRQTLLMTSLEVVQAICGINNVSSITSVLRPTVAKQ